MRKLKRQETRYDCCTIYYLLKTEVIQTCVALRFVPNIEKKTLIKPPPYPPPQKKNLAVGLCRRKTMVVKTFEHFLVPIPLKIGMKKGGAKLGFFF